MLPANKGAQRRCRKIVRFLLCLTLLGVLAGCSSPDLLVPEAHPQAWTPTEIENLLAGNDPHEEFNRSMFACTSFTMDYVADPLCRVYTSLFPRPFIEHLNNVCTNLDYPYHAVSCLLQKEWGGAGDDSMRFLINSTVGLAGIFDPAAYWWSIPSSGADFGQAFAAWGLGPGETFVLPLVPAFNRRDLLGTTLDTVFDLKTYIPYAGYATFLNELTVKQSIYAQMSGDTLDPYRRFRQLAAIERELQRSLWLYRQSCRMRDLGKAKLAKEKAAKEAKKDGKGKEKTSAKSNSIPKPKDSPAELIPPEGPPGLCGNWIGLPEYHSQDPVTDSIRSIMARATRERDFWFMRLSIFNRDFESAASVRKLALLPDRPKLRYAFWQADKPASDAPPRRERLAILLPGIGGCWNATLQILLAEGFYDKGFHVAAFDSMFHGRFVVADSACELPGYLPDDARRLRRVILAMLDDLKRHGKIVNPEIVLCGYSLGGLHTLKIAELEERDPQIVIERYVAINPPVSIMSALKMIDKLVDLSAGWSKTELRRRLVEAAGTLFIMTQVAFPKFDPQLHSLDPELYQVKLDPASAGYLVGLSLKLSMADLLMTAHREKPLPGVPAASWGKRNAAYLAIDRFTMKDYALKLLAPRYHEPLEVLAKQCGLQAMEPMLRTNPKIRIFHNYDDFLVTKEERQWLDRTLQKRITWFSNGGHLGNLYYLSVLKVLLQAAQPDDPAHR